MTATNPAASSDPANSRLLRVKNFVAASGFYLCILIALVVVANQYQAAKALDPFFRVSIPTLCLIASFVTSLISLRLGVISCLFVLPLLPDLAWQIQQHLGYGRIFASHASGLDLCAGLLLGSLVNQLRARGLKDFVQSFPWVASVVMIMITASVGLAIARNLLQTASPFYISALLHSLLNLRAIGWHDDYRPLFDWVAYGCAFSLLAVLIPTLKSTPNRNELVFIPLIASLTIAALVGVRQSIFGFGLSPVQLNFRLDQFGFMALGFQPDIHAFAGQMLIGAIGLFGYLYYQKNIWWRVILLGMVVPLCWFALFLSKSKASLGLAFCLTGVMVLLWFFRHAKYLRASLIGFTAVLAGLLVSAFVLSDLWQTTLTQIVQRHGIKDLATLNVKLSYRPEVYLAALSMFSLYPIFGLGQGEFYHQSANHELTKSYFLSLEQNGENAHNYFLQVLVENGAVGFLLFVLLLAYPFWKTKDKTKLIPAWIALLAVFAGNIFSHSMLVRENMFIAASFVALMYAWMISEPQLTKVAESSHHVSKRMPLFLLSARSKTLFRICAVVVIALSVREVYSSFKTGPFLVDIQCQKQRGLERDGWTSGYYKIIDVPAGAHGITLNLATTQPDVARHPLPGSIGLLFNESLVVENKFELNRNGPQKLSFNFPPNTRATPDDYQIDLRLQRCFIPKNFGMGADSRRLGVKIESLDWHY